MNFGPSFESSASLYDVQFLSSVAQAMYPQEPTTRQSQSAFRSVPQVPPGFSRPSAPIQASRFPPRQAHVQMPSLQQPPFFEATNPTPFSEREVTQQFPDEQQAGRVHTSREMPQVDQFRPSDETIRALFDGLMQGHTVSEMQHKIRDLEQRVARAAEELIAERAKHKDEKKALVANHNEETRSLNQKLEEATTSYQAVLKSARKKEILLQIAQEKLNSRARKGEKNAHSKAAMEGAGKRTERS